MLEYNSLRIQYAGVQDQSNSKRIWIEFTDTTGVELYQNPMLIHECLHELSLIAGPRTVFAFTGERGPGLVNAFSSKTQPSRLNYKPLTGTEALLPVGAVPYTSANCFLSDQMDNGWWVYGYTLWGHPVIMVVTRDDDGDLVVVDIVSVDTGNKAFVKRMAATLSKQAFDNEPILVGNIAVTAEE